MAKKKFLTASEKKARKNKVGELVWLIFALVFLAGGVVFGILHLIVSNITNNQTKSPLYFLIQFRDAYGSWVVSWWTSFHSDNVFLVTSLVALGLGLVVMLITLLVTSNRQESINKKEQARLLRERNVRRFEEAQALNGTLEVAEPSSSEQNPENN